MSISSLKAHVAQAAAQVTEASSPELATEAEMEVAEGAARATPAIPDHAAQDGLFTWLKGFSGYWSDLLPPGINRERFELATLAAIQNSDSIRKAIKVNHNSLIYSLAMCAHFGLMPDGVQAALVPYKGIVKFIPMYRGYVALMLRTGMIRSVHFDHICEGDTVSLNKGALPPDDFTHEIDVFRIDDDDRVPRVAYTYAWLKDGARTEVVLMGRLRAEAIRDEFSQSYRNAEQERKKHAKDFADNPWKSEYHSPWHDHFDAMWLKSVLHLLAKRLDLSPEVSELVAADTADLAHVERVATPAKVMRVLAEPAAREIPAGAGRHAYVYDDRTDPWCGTACGAYEDDPIHLTS